MTFLFYSPKWDHVFEAIDWGAGRYREVWGNYPKVFCYGRYVTTQKLIGIVLEDYE